MPEPSAAMRERGPGPPRVLVVIGQLDVGGTERHLAQMLPRLRAADIDVSVFTLKAGGPIADFLRRAEVPVLTHPSRVDGWRGLVQSAVMLAGLLRRTRPDIVHFYLPAAYLVGALCSSGLSIRRIMSRRSLSTYQARYPGVSVIERLMHRRMDVILANSRAVANELLAEGVPRERLGLIYNAAAIPAGVPDRAAARARLNVPGDSLVFVCVANLIPYKGHRDLLAALARVRERLPANWLLALVGRDNGIESDLRAQAERDGIGAHVRWIGSVPDVSVYLAAADIGVLASHEEGFSNAVLEGMALGLPMVVTNAGGNGEAVIDGECGRVVPRQSPAALAAALLELASSPPLRTQWGQRARARVRDCFSEARCVALYEELYRNLAQDLATPVPADARIGVDADSY